MVNDLYPLLFAFVAGLAIGMLYLGGLWLTMRQIPRASQPQLLMGVSFLGRIGLTFIAFYLVAGSHWQRLLACFLGFFLLRTVLIRWQVRKLKVS
jgi:F1F0 ATPase subunit 2